MKPSDEEMFLMEASKLYEDLCPELTRFLRADPVPQSWPGSSGETFCSLELARFLRQQAHTVMENRSDEGDAQRKAGGWGPIMCQYCCQRFRPDGLR
ncbi:hypothetical protein NHX12_023349, partial [Muraenolepis orangiensis]